MIEAGRIKSDRHWQVAALFRTRQFGEETMSRGFGATQPKRRARKPLEQKGGAQKAAQSRQGESNTSSKISLEKDWQINLEKQALAWYAGAYNPLADIEPEQVRAIAAEEEEWLFLARTIGWLEVDDELDAIYFTAPPPAFDAAQADWYLRPDLMTLIEKPILLKEALICYPIPQDLVEEAIAHHAKRLKWNSQKIAAFIQEVTDKTRAELTDEDYAAILLELQHLRL